MALRHFPLTFGTKCGKKGFFPHFFNKKENENYVGPYSPASDFGYDEMTSLTEKQELKEWWESMKGKEMNFQKELTDYCIHDVLVMMRGCLKYRELYVTLFGVDPFQELMNVFVKNFLKPNTLGVVPPMGLYRPCDVYSFQALEWLYSLNISCLLSALSFEG